MAGVLASKEVAASLLECAESVHYNPQCNLGLMGHGCLIDMKIHF